MRGDNQLAIKLSELATHKVIKHHNHDNKLICLINKAQAYKWIGKNDTCHEIVKEIDWSACSDKFKLASSVLMDDFTESFKVMKRIGKDHDEVTKECYKDWPLFKELRKHVDFPKIFEEIFSEKFEHELDEDMLFGIFQRAQLDKVSNGKAVESKKES